MNQIDMLPTQSFAPLNYITRSTQHHGLTFAWVSIRFSSENQVLFDFIKPLNVLPMPFPEYKVCQSNYFQNWSISTSTDQF